MLCYLNFPIGYQTENRHNDNLDVQVILPNGEVYFLIVITLENIQYLMQKEDIGLPHYFWIEDMLIVKEVSLEGIKRAIKQLLLDEKLEQVGSRIGTTSSIFGGEAPLHRLHLVE